jgi:hypothetical protein
MPVNPHSAAGTAAGFSYQFERALYWLAQSPAGAVIGVETDDDVTVRSASGSLFEQDKHSIRSNTHPFGDRSKDLWNTLSIWLDALDKKQITIESAHFLMVTNKLLPKCIAKQIDNATSVPHVEACIKALQKAGKKPPGHIKLLVKRVLCADSRHSLRALIAKINVVDSSKAASAPQLRQKTISHLQLPDWCLSSADSIADELLGWLHKTAMNSWCQKQPAWMQRDHFINQLHAIVDRRKRQIRRERAEHLIPITDDIVGNEKGRPFVKQLYLVTEDDGIVDTSIREFIRCNIEKIRLSKEGNVTDEDWTTFESMLLSRWDKIRSRVVRMRSGSAEEVVGFEIFTETTEDYREKLAGTDTEQVYLTSGTYHRLADLLRVGWHPRYLDIIGELLKTP